MPGPTVTGPYPTGSSTFGGTLYGTSFNLSRVGYESSEYFLSGTANSYVPVNPLTTDGKWNVTTGTSAPYKTRIVVDRPIAPTKFKGRSWSSGSTSAADRYAQDWMLTHDD